MVDHSLQLRLSQKLALAPQLQQAIRLLQLTRIELREHLQATVEANPLLDFDEPGGEAAADSADDWDTPSQGEDSSAAADDPYGDYDDQWGEDMGGGEQWAEAGFSVERENQIADESGDSLRDHLMFQVELGQFNDRDAAIATAIIFALDEDGYLLDSIDDIRDSLLPDLETDEAEIRAVMRRVQRMEPVGVATNGPAECIRVQLAVLPASTPGRDLAQRVARDYIDLVADAELERLKRETGAGDDDLETALDLIRSLEPRPGARYDNRQQEYLVPDVYTRQVEGRWVTYLSPDNDPRLKLNTYYVQLLRQSGGEDRKYLQGRLQEARWLLSSLELRNRTLMNVSQAIVDHQSGFMDDGDIAMKPLILKDIAEQVGVHESTVSRATTRKYIFTPRGLFELKYFFSSHVRTLDGGDISAIAVKAHIQSLVEAEPASKPLSDQELSRLLREAGIRAARRTVAKYRESLGIGSSSERRRAYRRLAARAVD
ncbi:RNA polymerase factor sigma-54 [Marinihelvus fidelis]|uniref:RNA polymerase sigma-54 factor n=1 Tax=Marinihelvus fidelis TaxID=2613842 RepID=A0A5N0TFM2_9GAMM|nr:RNA polymerase factor sigma-54 [Marinihelvus fidelis]KAA9133421.1 RNA polymerase factor sigma-54 [Marinihelvus fidelis]